MEKLDPVALANEGQTAQSKSQFAQFVSPTLSIALAVLGLVWAGGALLALGFQIQTEQVLAAAVGLSLALVFLNTSPTGKPRERLTWYDGALALIGLAVGLYLAARFPVLSQERFYRPVETTVVGGVLVVLVAEALRRTAGWSLFLVLMGFFAYAFSAHLVPGSLQGRPIAANQFFSLMGIDTTAMLGIPLTVITGIVIAFVFFGQLLLRSGGSEFFTDLASSLMGQTRGGAAKISVIASAFFGSISGSAVANVVSTGVVTIPLMRRSGYSAPVAGAIEAVASTGGQLMPPIMGAAAFLMAELLAVPYQEVVIAAIIPALLYYTSVFVQADLEAARKGILPVPKELIPGKLDVLRRGWYFLVPFVALLVALFNLNAPAEKAALYGAAVVFVLGSIFTYSGKRLTPRIVLKCMTETGAASVDIVIIGAAAGLILGILDATGLSFGLTLVLVEIGQKNLLLLLAMTGCIGIILGMGMPTTASYFLLATLAAPPIIKLGVEPIAAHMFVLFFGMMSMITPPVALAAFTAAKLAGAGPMETALAACRFGWPAFVIPFLFVLSPTLLMRGAPLDVAHACITAFAGIWITSGAFSGYLLGRLGLIQRVALALAGLAVLMPANAFPGAFVVEASGAAACTLLLAWQYRFQPKPAAVTVPGLVEVRGSIHVSPT